MAAASTLLEPDGKNRKRQLFKTTTYCKGRNPNGPETDNEDRLLVHETPWGTLMAAIDGITPQTAFKARHPEAPRPVTTGWIGAWIVEKHLKTFSPDMTFTELVTNIHAEWMEELDRLNAPQNEGIGAVFVVFVPWMGPYGTLCRLGDALWGYETKDGHWVDCLDGQAPENSLDAKIRGKAIWQEMARLNLHTTAGLSAEQLGNLARIGWDALQAGRRKRGSSGFLNSLHNVLNYIQPKVQLTKPVRRLVLATDGWLRVPRNLSSGQAYLSRLQKEDCLMLGINHDGVKTAKGFVDSEGTILDYTDDVGLVVAEAV